MIERSSIRDRAKKNALSSQCVENKEMKIYNCASYVIQLDKYELYQTK